MKKPLEHQLSRRERQVRWTSFTSTGPVPWPPSWLGCPTPPSYSAIRALLRTLEEKGHIRHLEQGPRYLYEPIQDRERARDSALQHLVETFFDGSPERAVSALLDSRKRLDPAALARIAARLKQEREKGR